MHVVRELRNAVPCSGAGDACARRHPLFFRIQRAPEQMHEVCSLIGGMLDDTPGVQYLRAEQIECQYPVEVRLDPEADRLGRIPYTELYFSALATALVRQAHALFTPPYKVIALDCDNTLWQGICGEDGPQGVVIDPPRRALQEFMLAQRRSRHAAVLCSKNNEEDVLDTFAAQSGDAAAARAFRGLAHQLGIQGSNLAALAAGTGARPRQLHPGGRQSQGVRRSGREPCPKCSRCRCPRDVDADARSSCATSGLSIIRVVTEEDRHRSAYYTQAQEFGREIKRATNLEEFVCRRCSSRSSSRRRRPSTWPRRATDAAHQPVQLHDHPPHRERDLEALGASGYECVTVDVADRFGSYGLIGRDDLPRRPGARSTSTRSC